MTLRRDETSGWIVLRCSGSNTLKLAGTLSADGFDVWTPVEEVDKRKPRRPGRNRETLPVMAGYIFAKARHLLDLLEMSHPDTNPERGFSVFRHNGRFPLIADEALNPLRVIERKRTPADKAPRFTKGEMVKLTEGGFAGLSGVVELTRGQFTLVTFPGFPMPIKISSFLLLPEARKVIARAA